MQNVIVYFDSWAGRTSTTAELLSVTPKRYRVRWLEDGIRTRKGRVGLVPKHAVAAMHGETLPA